MWEEIVKSFTDLTPILWASQIAGLIGFAIIGISYFFKKKIFVLLAAISMVFFCVEQILACLYSNMIVTGATLIRNIIMVFILWKKGKEIPLWGSLCIAGATWCCVLIYMGVTHSFNQWDNYIPPLFMTLTTFTQNNKNEYVVKVGAIIQESGFMIYYILYRLPFSVLRQATLVVACIIGLILLIIRHFKNKNNKEELDESIQENIL